MLFKPKKKKLEHFKADTINKWDHVPIKVLVEAEDLAKIITVNERAINLLRAENKTLRERVNDIMLQYKIPFINITIEVKNIKENYSLTLVTERGEIPVDVGLFEILKVKLKSFGVVGKNKRTELAKNISTFLTTLLRKDAILVSVLRSTEWGTILETKKETKPYIMLQEGHNVSNTAKQKI